MDVSAATMEIKMPGLLPIMKIEAELCCFLIIVSFALATPRTGGHERILLQSGKLQGKLSL